MSTEDVIRAIDGALADDEFPDAMRWSPDPSSVTDASTPFDGSHVTVGEDLEERFPVIPVLLPRGRPGFRGGMVPSHVIVDDPIRTPARGEVVQRDGWRMVDNRYLPEPATAERIAGAFGVREDVAGMAAILGPTFTRVVTVHEDDGSLTLILEPDTERLEAAFAQVVEQAQRMSEVMGVAFRRVAEAFSAVGSSLQPLLERAGLIEDQGPDPIEQPFERALWHKARQGTGPDRQVQHRPRPRRHVL